MTNHVLYMVPMNLNYYLYYYTQARHEPKVCANSLEREEEEQYPRKFTTQFTQLLCTHNCRLIG